MNLSQIITNLLGRLLGLTGTESITDYGVSFAAPWANKGPAWLLFGCVALSVAAVAFYARYERRRHAGVRGVLAAARAVVLCLLLVMLAEPILTVTINRQVRPLLCLLVDGTDSMAIRDRLDEKERDKLFKAVGMDPAAAVAEDPNAPPPSRIDFVKSLFQREDDNLLAKLEAKLRIQAFVFDSAHGVHSLKLSSDGSDRVDGEYLAEQLTVGGEVTALGTALDALKRRHASSNLAGVAIFSDFNQNTGKLPVEAAKRLGVRMYAVGIGSTKADDVFVALDAPLIMKKDERATVTVVVGQSGFDNGDSVKVTLTARRLDASGEAENEPILVGERTVQFSGPSKNEEFQYVPEETGRYVFRVEVEPLGGEAGYENNHAEREVTVRDDFLRLLYVEDEPTWEWRFIKEVFHRDKLVGMEGFHTFLRWAHPRVKQSQEMFLSNLTPSRKEFFANDVIFLGDMPATALSDRFCEWTKEFVDEFGGGLVILSGPRFGPDQLVGTVLEDMLPVRFDPATGGSGGARIQDKKEFALRLTPWAKRYDFMQLGANEEENAEGWSNLGRLPWYVRVDGLHSGTRVLAEHPVDPCIGTDDNESDFSGGELLSDDQKDIGLSGSGRPHRQPLIAIRKFGKGEVVYLAFNETWRLRRKFGERYYRQFWGQMIHRLGLSHALGSQKRFVVQTDRPTYRAEDDVLLSVQAYDEDYQPLTETKLTQILELSQEDPVPKLRGELILPRGAGGGNDSQRVSLSQVRAGVFETMFPVFTGGEYFVRIIDPVTGEPVEASFKVKTSDPIERRNPNRDIAVQEAIADANPGGRSYELADVYKLVDQIEAAPKTEITKRSKPLWLTWLFFGCVVGLLLGEWLLRKWVNLQ